VEWPGIQIPLALITLLEDRPLICPFSDKDGNTLKSNIRFYDRTMAEKCLDFNDCPDARELFLRYSVSFNL
jgi:hypothetical protein